MVTVASHPVQGHVGRGFETVREVFAENFARRGELGGACCAYYRGEKVVDLWAGIRDKQTGEPWEQDTMVVVHSATKGLAAMTLAVAHSRGWLDYEERVARCLENLKRLIHEGNVRRIVVQHQNRTVAEFPVTAGVLGAVLAPVVAAIGAIVALLKDCTIRVERTTVDEHSTTKPASPAA